jgi:uncharacterized protein (TIGR03083 family)
MKNMCADLAAEQDELDGFVADLDEAGWNTQTPAEGWTIKDQIRHLAYYEERARLAASDPKFFKQWMSIAQAYAGPPGQGRKQEGVLKRKQ